MNSELPKINIWLSAREAGRKISRSHDYINKRGIPFQDTPVQGLIRFKLLDGEKRYLEDDIENLLQMPPTRPYELTI